jgi:four helix bundle protein
MQDHHKLEIWKMACALTIDLRAAADRFPKRGYAELKAQLISAAESMAENIVEGCGAESQKEFARFLSMSIKSNRELEGELEIAHGYHILTERDWQALTNYTVLIRKKTYTLRNKVLNSLPPKNPKPRTPNRKPQTG